MLLNKGESTQVLIWHKFPKSEKFCAVQPPPVLPQPSTSARLKARLLPRSPDPEMVHQHQAAARFPESHGNVSALSSFVRPDQSLSFCPEPPKHPGSEMPLAQLDTGGDSAHPHETGPAHTVQVEGPEDKHPPSCCRLHTSSLTSGSSR